LGAGQTGPGYSIDSKTGKSPALTTAGLADAVINYVNIGPDIYATIGSPKPIPPSVQKKIRAGLSAWGYGKPPASLTGGVSVQLALFTALPGNFVILGEYLGGTTYSKYKTTLFVESSQTGATLYNTIAHEFFHYYERSVQGITSSEDKAQKFGDMLYP
jgi:hypothetical protein